MEQRRLFRLKWRKRFLGCTKKLCCFKDEEEEFDEEARLPTCKQVCCWRFLRSRRRANMFHTSVASLQQFEKSKCQNFISLLLTINYLLLYAVAIIPFVIIFTHKPMEEVPE